MTTMTAEQVLRELVACEDLRVAIVRANSVGRMNDRQFARFERMRAEHARRSLQAWLAARDIVNHKEQA